MAKLRITGFLLILTVTSQMASCLLKWTILAEYYQIVSVILILLLLNIFEESYGPSEGTERFTWFVSECFDVVRMCDRLYHHIILILFLVNIFEESCGAEGTGSFTWEECPSFRRPCLHLLPPWWKQVHHYGTMHHGKCTMCMAPPCNTVHGFAIHLPPPLSTQLPYHNTMHNITNGN